MNGEKLLVYTINMGENKMKFSKEIVLSIAPYKTMRIAVTEADSFKDCDRELMSELNRHPEIKKLNVEEIAKVLA